MPAKKPKRRSPRKSRKLTDPAAYARDLAATHVRKTAQSLAHRDIAGGYPEPGDLARRAECERSLRRFCEVYFPAAFFLAWSHDHLMAIADIEQCVFSGGTFAFAMPRGYGKSAICARAVIWATLYGHRDFAVLIGATEDDVSKTLDTIKIELSTNELLLADFRAVCYPFSLLENNARRCGGQLFEGKPTRLEWQERGLVFPTIPDSACDGKNVSGATIFIRPITGAIRGIHRTAQGGRILRPDLVILDDPQTRESAQSPTQCTDRSKIINGDVMGLSGPGRRPACAMPCTVIRPGDLADEYLDHERHPQWRGRRTRAVYSWPSNRELWDRYHVLRNEGLVATGSFVEATRFYADNRVKMDADAVVAWPERFYPDELSAVQHNENLRADLGDEYEAEYQNDPKRPEQSPLLTLTPDEVAHRLNGVDERIAPSGSEHVTAFVDVHDDLLFWTVCAWRQDFTGAVIAYGTYPSQERRRFVRRKVTRTLATMSPGATPQGAIAAGLKALVPELLASEWFREDGAALRIERMFIDAGYVPSLVRDLCRRSTHAAVLMPSRGFAIGAKSRPFEDYRREKGDRFGLNWWIPGPRPGRSDRHIRFETNGWKALLHGRLAMSPGDPGALTLWGNDPNAHVLLAEHLTSEYAVRVSANGRTVDEWRLRPGTTDNHWLDCLVGCAVGASLCGCATEDRSKPAKVRRRLTLQQWRDAAKVK